MSRIKQDKCIGFDGQAFFCRLCDKSGFKNMFAATAHQRGCPARPSTVKNHKVSEPAKQWQREQWQKQDVQSYVPAQGMGEYMPPVKSDTVLPGQMPLPLPSMKPDIVLPGQEQIPEYDDYGPEVPEVTDVQDFIKQTGLPKRTFHMEQGMKAMASQIQGLEKRVFNHGEHAKARIEVDWTKVAKYSVCGVLAMVVLFVLFKENKARDFGRKLVTDTTADVLSGVSRGVTKKIIENVVV